MDLSSKYFNSINRPGLSTVKNILKFFHSAYKVGKITELVSFSYWEVCHYLKFYKRGSYVTFTNELPYFLSPENTSVDPVLRNSFLERIGLFFEISTIDWRYCIKDTKGNLWGNMHKHLNGLYTNPKNNDCIELVWEFSFPIQSIFVSKENTIFICSNGCIFRSNDFGKSFISVLSLSSPISYFLFNNGMTELPDQTLLIGEYGSIWHDTHWQNLAYVYTSTDKGNTWNKSDFLMKSGVNKHIHLVKYSKYLNATFLTDGDNKKQIWINSTINSLQNRASRKESGWQLINRFHFQTGGYTSMTDTPSGILFGSDYLGGTNFLVGTSDGKQFQKLIIPDPYRRSPIMQLFTRHSSKGNEIWAFLYSCFHATTRSLLMCSLDNGKTWTRVIDFDGTRNEVRLASSSAADSDLLYISITTYGVNESDHKHYVYKLKAS